MVVLSIVGMVDQSDLHKCRANVKTSQCLVQRSSLGLLLTDRVRPMAAVRKEIRIEAESKKTSPSNHDSIVKL